METPNNSPKPQGMKKAIPNPNQERALSQTQIYYTLNKDKWTNFYNKKDKVYCDICKKNVLFIKTHLKSKLHKNNVDLKQKDDLLKSILQNIT